MTATGGQERAGAAEGGQGRPQTPYGWAAVVAGLVLAVYVLTIAPTTQFWDTSEYIAAAKVLGIPHPPGNPLFVVMAHVWGMIPLVSHYALRINLFAAVTSAVGSGFLFLVAERSLQPLLADRWTRMAAAFLGAMVGATSFTVWNQSVVNEKVYTLSLFFIGLIVWLAFVWADRSPGPARDRTMLLIVYLLALTSTNHLMGTLAGVAVLALAWQTIREERAKGLVEADEWIKWLVVALGTILLLLFGMESRAAIVVGAIALVGVVSYASVTGNARFALIALALFAAGLSLNLFLPIRAAHFPAINEGEPTSWYAFWSVFSREQYAKPPITARQADLIWQYANYLQYFAWQFAHDYGEWARRGAAAVFAALGLVGAIRHWQLDRRRALALTAFMATLTVVLIFYLNFRYGFSIRPGENLDREVRERDYFFIASFQLWGVWVALGLGTLLEAAADALREAKHHTMRWLPLAPAFVIGLFPLWANHLTASRAGETLPRDFAYDILQSVEPYGILVTAGDNDTFPLWYAQEVEHIRRDVTLLNLSLGNTPWHIRQVKRRGQEPFDSTDALPLYRGRAWPEPMTPPLTLSMEQIDALPGVLPLDQRRMFRAGNLRAVLQGAYLDRVSIVVLQMITDNLGKRPIYLSRTVGPYGQQMGLEPYLLGQGMVRKVMPDSITASDSVASLPGLGWVELPRTEALLWDVYHYRAAERHRPRGWQDPPSVGILSLYGLLYASYGNWAAQHADSGSVRAQRAQEAANIADQIFTEAGFGR